MDAHQIDVERNDLDGVDIEWYDQLRTPLTPKMIEITLKNYKSWMNTGFFIEITFAVRGPLSLGAEKEVNIPIFYLKRTVYNDFSFKFSEPHELFEK